MSLDKGTKASILSFNEMRESIILETIERTSKSYAQWNDGCRRLCESYGQQMANSYYSYMYSAAQFALPLTFDFVLNPFSFRKLFSLAFIPEAKRKIRFAGDVQLVKRLAESGTIVLVPAHCSNFDAAFLGYAFFLLGIPPLCYGAGLNLFSNKVLGFIMSRIGTYTVDRKNKEPLYTAFLKNFTITLLKRGIHTVFFPGGTRSRSGAIETKLKLGLLGSSVLAQSEVPSAKMYFIPATVSYHFVFEASSLMREHLGLPKIKSRKKGSIIALIKRVLPVDSEIVVSLGTPLDACGNKVLGEANMASVCDLSSDQKIQDATIKLSENILRSYREENVVIGSNVASFSLLSLLREKKSNEQWEELEKDRIPYDLLLERFKAISGKLINLEKESKVRLSKEFFELSAEKLLEESIAKIGIVHEKKAIKVQDSQVFTEDINLLRFYGNRLKIYDLWHS